MLASVPKKVGQHTVTACMVIGQGRTGGVGSGQWAVGTGTHSLACLGPVAGARKADGQTVASGRGRNQSNRLFDNAPHEADRRPRTARTRPARTGLDSAAAAGHWIGGEGHAYVKIGK